MFFDKKDGEVHKYKCYNAYTIAAVTLKRGKRRAKHATRYDLYIHMSLAFSAIHATLKIRMTIFVHFRNLIISFKLFDIY